MKRMALAAALTLALPAFASASTLDPVFGVAVSGNGSHTVIDRSNMPQRSGEDPAGRAGIDAIVAASAGTIDDVIGYYIPLDESDYPTNRRGNTRCTYGSTYGGNACGLQQDYGDGGVAMQMWLQFSPLQEAESTLNLYFEDLDIDGFNDPTWFEERLAVFGQDGNRLTLPEFTSPPSSVETQQVSVGLGLLEEESYWVRLRFSADSDYRAYNTPEFMIASITQIAAVPLPAGAWLLIAALGGLGSLRGRKTAV